ncbi:hypothetical protein CRYUN_Cryun40dG0038400 [Craigia yunnanensis]
METWFIFSTLCISVFLTALFNLLFPCKKLGRKLPPGPPTFPFIGNAIWLSKSISDLGPIVRSFHAKFGNMITLHIGSYPAIFVRDHSLAHKALVQNAAVFAYRPHVFSVNIYSSNQHTITTAGYAPNWRILRKNLTSEILTPSWVRSYSHACKYAMFYLLALMCFGDKLDEKQIRRIEDVQRDLLLNLLSFNILDAWPRVTKVLFYKLWKEFLGIRQNQEDVFIPLVRARKKAKQENLSKVKEDKESKEEDEFILSYVDTSLELQLPEEKRKLNEGEMVSLCSEFLNAATDTLSTALQWIMANLVKYPHIQEKLFMEIKGVVGEGEEEAKEDDLQKMPYLKAVVLEGSKEIKMIPFGAGRRICPAIGLAMLHLEYFVANLVWSFAWKAVDGDDVDLSEKQEFTMVMKTPLQAHLYSRPI